ncbi:MAG: hypothetical protein DPW09_09625 [Anaerolineae bacterium]|nr:hypothetical protein [Anaerolineales bacterium]MCQ3973689.1 hypothetical protein [Anaerolineae bacterium]
MQRLQISLEENQYEFLRSEAFVTGQSMAALLRDLLDEAIQKRQDEILREDPIWQAIGVAQEVEGPTDVSANVDRYLYGEPVEAVNGQSLLKVAEAADEYLTD